MSYLAALILAVPILLVWSRLDSAARASDVEMLRLNVAIQKLADQQAGPFVTLDAAQASEPPAETIVFEDVALGFRAVTALECAGRFTIRRQDAKSDGDAEARFDLNLHATKDWKEGARWYSYVIYPQAVYDAIPDGKSPGKPDVLLTLEDGRLLTRQGPQDGPLDLGDCRVSVVRI